MRVAGFAVAAAGQPLLPWSYERPAPGKFEIVIAISHCGLCASDLHFMKNSWGNAVFPMIPGHEIVGCVAELGEGVESLQLGQRVGVSWQQGACLHCDWCQRGQEQFCQQIKGISIGLHGGFADKICVDSRFVHVIPDNLAAPLAAPLLCAGATVFNALKSFDMKAGMRVGIIGIGGLGHLAIQFATALGCEVTAFSSSPDKANDSERFGAKQFINVNDSDAIERQRAKFDFILSTCDRSMNYHPYLEALKPQGKLCFVAMPADPVTLAISPLVAAQRSICAIQQGNRHMIEQTLAFAIEHDICPDVETINMADVKHAIERLEKGLARYRIVLANET